MRSLRLLIALLCALPAAAGAAGKSYPAKPIKMVVAFLPATLSGVTARLLSERLTQTWGMSVIVQKIEGGAGGIAAMTVAKAPPDGYVLFCSTDAALTTLPAAHADLPYDPLKDFTPISLLARSANVLVVDRWNQARSVQDLVAAAKARPGKLTFASAGIETSQHLAGELFKSVAGIDLKHVPYQGGPLGVRALVEGKVSMMFANVHDALPSIHKGELHALAVSSAERWPTLPSVPTMAEAGFAGFDAVAWVGLVGPAGLPAEVVHTLQQQIAKILVEPKVRAKLADFALEPVASSPEALEARIRTEIAQREKLMR